MPANGPMVDGIRENARLVASAASDQLGAEVAYDETAVRWLDAFIQKEHEDGNPENRPGLVNTLGSFLGECVIRTYGGDWAQLDGDWAIRFDERNVVFPFRKVEKHLGNGGSDSVLSFFTLIPTVFSRPSRHG